MKKPAAAKDVHGVFFLSGLFTALIIAHAVFVFSGNQGSSTYHVLERTWGFDHLSYFPVPLALFFYVIGLLLILPPLNLKLGLLIRKTVEAHRTILISLGRKRTSLFFVLSAGSVVMFYLLRVRYDLLGDTLIRASQTVGKDFHPADYGSMFALHHLCNALSPLGITPRQAFVSHSIAAGACFVFISLLVADSLGRTFLHKAAIFLFSITVGAVQQFFGYPEVYAIPAVLWLTYIYCCILYLEGRVGIVLPLVTLMVCLVFHLVSLALIPSLLVLIHQGYHRANPVFKWIRTKYVALLAILILPLLYLAADLTNYDLLPVYASPDQPSQMTLFSIPHLWEFFNSQLLASGSGIFLFGYVFYRFIESRKVAEPVVSFLMSVSFSSVLFLFVFNATLGSNDWDLYAFPAIAYNLLGIYYISGTHYRRATTVRYVVPILIFLNLMSLAPWILINASDRSVERIKQTLPSDPGLYWVSHPPTMHLSIAFEANGLLQEAFAYYKKYHQENPDDIRGHFNYAKQLVKRNNLAEGIRELEKLMQVAPYSPWAYQALVVIYERSGEYAKIYSVVKRMFEAYSRNPRPFRELIDQDELMNYLDFLLRAELDRGDEAGAEAVRKAIEATALYFNTSAR